MSDAIGYKPSVFRLTKYYKYFLYQLEFLKRGDFKSLRDSFRYVLFHSLPGKNRINNSVMGTFHLRKNTTDFQFINWTYEKEIKKHIRSNFTRIGLFIDIGACIGEYDIWLAQQGIRCIAFEPVNFTSIEKNVHLNKAENLVTIYNCALGSASASVVFHVLNNVTGSSRINNSSKNCGAAVEVKRLDELISSSIVPANKLLIIKADVEGMELDVLKGAEKLIRRSKQLHIIYEYCITGDGPVRDLLNQFGKFQYRDLDGVNALAIKVN